jgi:hypothetical protein
MIDCISCTVRRKPPVPKVLDKKDQYVLKLLTDLRFLFFEEDFLERVGVTSLNTGSLAANQFDILLLAAANYVLKYLVLNENRLNIVTTL